MNTIPMKRIMNIRPSEGMAGCVRFEVKECYGFLADITTDEAKSVISIIASVIAGIEGVKTLNEVFDDVLRREAAKLSPVPK